MKDGRLYVRLSKGDKDRLLEMSKPYGGVGEFLVRTILTAHTEKCPSPMGGIQGGLVKPTTWKDVPSTCPACGKPARYCVGLRVGCVNKGPELNLKRNMQR